MECVIDPTVPPTVLVVEDNATMRETLATALSAAGARVLRAVDGRDALVQAELTLPDIVISDIEMPRMDGFALCRSFKESPRTRHVPVVLMSGAEVSPDGLAGADAFLPKPFPLHELHRVIRQLLPAA